LVASRGIWPAWRLAAAAALATTALALPAAADAAPQPAGGLTQLAPPFNCIASGGTECGVITGKGLQYPTDFALAPDGRHLYSINQLAGGHVAVFAIDPATGALTQPAAPGDCISQGGGGGCGVTTAKGLAPGASSLAVSPDGRHTYVVSFAGDSVAVIARDPSTGALSQPAVPCLSTGITPSGCPVTSVVGMDAPLGTVVSPDGNNVYVAAASSNAVVEFSRNATTGELTQLAPPNDCISQSAASGCGVTSAKGLHGVRNLVMTTDGFLYALSSTTDAVAAFRRDPATGALSQLPAPDDCVSDVASTGCSVTDIRGMIGAGTLALSPDERNVYMSNSTGFEGSLVVLERTASGGLRQLAGTAGCIAVSVAGCATGYFGTVFDVAVAPDGANVYTGDAGDAVESFDRSPSGALTQLPPPLGCIADDDSSLDPLSCPKNAVGLNFTSAVEVGNSPPSVYTSSLTDHALAVFMRNVAPVCQPLAAKTAYARPVTVQPSCSDPNGDPFTVGLATGPANGTLGTVATSGRVTYTPRRGFFGADAFTLRASDGGAASDVSASVEVASAQPKVAILSKRIRLDRRGRARLRLRCPEGVNGSCRGSLTLRTAKKVELSRRKRVKLGKARFAIAPGKARKITVKLRGARRALVVRVGKLPVIARAVAADQAGKRGTSKRKLSLRRPRARR
jgi:DNA-binding beta-propeller fold protein YncE